MKVLHLNHSDNNGGAARAAYRIHHALRDAGVNSTMLVNMADAGDWTVVGPIGGLNKVLCRIRPPCRRLAAQSLADAKQHSSFPRSANVKLGQTHQCVRC